MSYNGRKKIHHFHLFYFLLKQFVGIWFRWFYRRYEVFGTNNIPKADPVIFAANHQNALMDALAILFSRPSSIVFLARADIFKNPLQAKILHLLKIMPVFRIRDGAENLNKNDETFDAALNVLKDFHPLCLMPEGNHGDKRRLRPLVKGIFRIAFQTQEELGESAKVKIVPVGIDYEHYQHFKKNLLVQYGTPVDVSEYLPLYKENKARAMNALRDRLSDEMKKLIIHIESDEYYDVYNELRSIYGPRLVKQKKLFRKSLLEKLKSEQFMIEKLNKFEAENPKGMLELASNVRAFKEFVSNKKLRYWLLRNQPFSPFHLVGRIVLLICGFPVFCWGLVFNYLPFRYPGNFFKKKKIKDLQFYSSFAFVVGLLTFNVWYWLLFIPIALFLKVWWIKWVYLLMIPLYSLLSYKYLIFVRKSMGVFRFSRIAKSNQPEDLRGFILWRDIIRQMDLIMK